MHEWTTKLSLVFALLIAVPICCCQVHVIASDGGHVSVTEADGHASCCDGGAENEQRKRMPQRDDDCERGCCHEMIAPLEFGGTTVVDIVAPVGMLSFELPAAPQQAMSRSQNRSERVALPPPTLLRQHCALII